MVTHDPMIPQPDLDHQVLLGRGRVTGAEKLERLPLPVIVMIDS